MWKLTALLALVGTGSATMLKMRAAPEESDFDSSYMGGYDAVDNRHHNYGADQFIKEREYTQAIKERHQDKTLHEYRAQRKQNMMDAATHFRNRDLDLDNTPN